MSLKDHLRQIERERAFYTTLSKHKGLDDPSLTMDGLLTICEDIEPSQYLGTGGFYFELFILRFGMEKHRKIFLDLFKTENSKMTITVQDELRQRSIESMPCGSGLRSSQSYPW